MPQTARETETHWKNTKFPDPDAILSLYLSNIPQGLAQGQQVARQIAEATSILRHHVDEIGEVVGDGQIIHCNPRSRAGSTSFMKGMMQRRLTTRRLSPPVVMLLLAGSLLIADTCVWLEMQRQLDRKLDWLIHKAAASGWQIRASSGAWGGWPATATRILIAPRLQGGDNLLPGGITWSGEKIVVSVSFLHPGRVDAFAGGTQMISMGTASVDSRGGSRLDQSLRFWGAEIALHLPAEAGSATFDARALHLALPGAGPDDVLGIGSVQERLHWTADAHALTLNLHEIGLPRRRQAAIGSVIPDAALELSLVGRIPEGGGALSERLHSWSAGNGHLLLRQAMLTWENSAIDVSGQASLDPNNSPIGDFVARVQDADDLLDRLVRSGRVAPAAAASVRAVLGLIAAGSDNREGMQASQSKPALSLPLTLRAGLLSLGQIPLLRLGPFLQ